MKLDTHRKQFSAGFSHLALVIVVAVIGIIGAVGVISIGNILSSAKGAKLNNDMVTLNSAVRSYLLFGGNFDGTESVDLVLTKLRSRANDATSDQVVGLRGSFLDPRCQPVQQSDDEAATDQPRLYWDSAKSRFLSATSGDAGIREFIINNDYVAPETELVEARETVVDYAHTSNWIWDYEDQAVPVHLQATVVNLASPGPPLLPVPTTPGTVTPPSPPPVLPPGTVLAQPVFSIPGGSYPITDFDLAVTITDPNATGSAVYYSLDAGPWTPYAGGPITVGPSGFLWAQAVPTSSEYLHSAVTAATYVGVSPLPLDPPTFNMTGGAFNLPGIDTINVSLVNPNDSAVSQINYRINGAAWQLFSGPNFSVKAEDYSTGATIDAYAASTSPLWTDSIQVSVVIPPPLPPDLTFDTSVSTSP